MHPNIKDNPILNNSSLSAKILSTNYNDDPYILTNEFTDAELLDNEYYPLKELTEAYGNSVEQYRDCGNTTAKELHSIISTYHQHQDPTHKMSILDWGCASGRVIRHLPKYLDASLYGCDINSNHIHWCQKYLNNIATFSQCTTLPHLPFEDNSLNVVYGLSIFTHISELIDMWMFELRRVLMPGGLLIVSLHDDNAYNIMLQMNHKVSNAIKYTYKEFPKPGTYSRFCAGNKTSFGNFMFFSNENINNTFCKILHNVKKLPADSENLTEKQSAVNLGVFQTTYVFRKDF